IARARAVTVVARDEPAEERGAVLLERRAARIGHGEPPVAERGFVAGWALRLLDARRRRAKDRGERNARAISPAASDRSRRPRGTVETATTAAPGPARARSGPRGRHASPAPVPWSAPPRRP